MCYLCVIVFSVCFRAKLALKESYRALYEMLSLCFLFVLGLS